MAEDVWTDRVTHLEVEAEPRYWEDATVDGFDDVEGVLIPGRDGDVWKVRLDLIQGRIEDWPQGTTADIHYKVCDQGLYWLTDREGRRLAKWKGFYVPSDHLCHGGSGHGDYIILKIDGDGRIRDYRFHGISVGAWDVI